MASTCVHTVCTHIHICTYTCMNTQKATGRLASLDVGTGLWGALCHWLCLNRSWYFKGKRWRRFWKEAAQGTSNSESLSFCCLDFLAFGVQECLLMKSLPKQRNYLNCELSSFLKIGLNFQSGGKGVDSVQPCDRSFIPTSSRI